MNILEDTRQQHGKHELKAAYMESCGDSIVRCKLPWGDYALAPVVSIDTKQSIYELAQDIDQQHNRFRAELKSAQEHGCHLVILVENDDGITSAMELEGWSESLEHYKMRLLKNGRAVRISGARLSKACRTMSDRYGAEFLFCKPEESGKIIRQILGDPP